MSLAKCVYHGSFLVLLTLAIVGVMPWSYLWTAALAACFGIGCYAWDRSEPSS